MAEKEENTSAEGAEEETPAGGPGKVVWLLVILVCAGLGAAVPFLMAGSPDDEEEEVSSRPYEMLRPEETAVVEFGDITVNLDEGQMNRYLRLKIAVLVAKEEELAVTEAIAARTPVLKNWLLSHLSDKGLAEIRGKAGLNMLRRELRRQFNETLFADQKDRVYDILFEEFNVQ